MKLDRKRKHAGACLEITLSRHHDMNSCCKIWISELKIHTFILGTFKKVLIWIRTAEQIVTKYDQYQGATLVQQMQLYIHECILESVENHTARPIQVVGIKDVETIAQVRFLLVA